MPPKVATERLGSARGRGLARSHAHPAAPPSALSLSRGAFERPPCHAPYPLGRAPSFFGALPIGRVVLPPRDSHAPSVCAAQPASQPRPLAPPNSHPAALRALAFPGGHAPSCVPASTRGSIWAASRTRPPSRLTRLCRRALAPRCGKGTLQMVRGSLRCHSAWLQHQRPFLGLQALSPSTASAWPLVSLAQRCPTEFGQRPKSIRDVCWGPEVTP